MLEKEEAFAKKICAELKKLPALQGKQPAPVIPHAEAKSNEKTAAEKSEDRVAAFVVNILEGIEVDQKILENAIVVAYKNHTGVQLEIGSEYVKSLAASIIDACRDKYNPKATDP